MRARFHSLFAWLRHTASAPLRDRYALGLLAILVLALALRLYRLDSDPLGLYYDEITSSYAPYLMVQQGVTLADLPSLLVSLVSGSFPIYFLFGPSPFFTRLPSAIYGTALVIPLYLLGQRLMNKHVGLIAGALVAVTPWTLLFSRYGVFASAYAFWVATYVYFLVAYCQTQKAAHRYAFGISMALSLYTLAMSLPFGFLFTVITLPALYASGKLPRHRDLVELFLYLVAGALPYLIFLIYPSAASSHAGYSAFQVAQGPTDFVLSWADSFATHLSPDFLVFSGGKGLALTSSPGFTHRISLAELYYYSDAGYHGMLNLYGILVYPAMIWIAYRVVLRKGELRDIILGSWIFCYALAAGYAYYDNPNAARNIEGVGAFILLIAWALISSLGLVHRWTDTRSPPLTARRRTAIKAAAAVSAIVLVAAPAASFLSVYFVTYPGLSAPYFDYEYQELAGYLTRNRLWDKNIYVYDDMRSYASFDLAFYNASARNNIITITNLTQLTQIPATGTALVILRTDAAYQVAVALGVPLRLAANLYYPNGSLAIIIAYF